MLRTATSLALLLPLAACTCEEGAERSASPDPEPDPTTSPTSPAPNLDGPATPTTLTIVSEDAEHRLDVSFGPASPFGFGLIDETAPAMGLDQPDSPSWPRACDCPCGTECPECEPPMPALVTVGPGAPHVFEWGGELRRYVVGAPCFETSPAPPGQYVFSVCAADDGPCAFTTATIPSPEGITLDFGSPGSNAECPLEEHILARATRTAVDTMRRSRVAESVMAACPEVATCISAEEVATRIDPTEPGCVIYAVPGGSRIDVIVQLDGLRYAHHLAGAATRLRGVSYPPRR